jgi:hypothetical protein
MGMSGAFMRNGSLPRGMVFGTALVLAGTFVLTTLGHQAPVNPAVAGALPAASRDLRFTDRADGAVVVTDARDGRQIVSYYGPAPSKYPQPRPAEAEPQPPPDGEDEDDSAAAEPAGKQGKPDEPPAPTPPAPPAAP